MEETKAGVRRYKGEGAPVGLITDEQGREGSGRGRERWRWRGRGREWERRGAEATMIVATFWQREDTL